MPSVETFSDVSGIPAMRGFVHHPADPSGAALVVTHGAGSNCNAPLLIRLADAFAGLGVTVLRCDLPFRQARPNGPPFPAGGAQDREGLRRAVLAMRANSPLVILGGHSYGGRQATMLAAEDPGLVSALLLLSYPLHPPRKPTEQRTAHLPKLRTPSLFVHGTRDPFGSVDELRSALALVPAPVTLLPVEGASHDLGALSSFEALYSELWKIMPPMKT